MSGGAIAGIVVGVIAAIIVIIVFSVVAVKFYNKKRVPPPQRPGREPGVAMQPFPPGAGAPPSSYDRTVGGEAQPSAPPYNPYYQRSFRYR